MAANGSVLALSAEALARRAVEHDQLWHHIHHQIRWQGKVDAAAPPLVHHTFFSASGLLPDWAKKHGQKTGMLDGGLACSVCARTVPFLEKVAVLMPTSRPLESSRAPPELPALILASVCTHAWLTGLANVASTQTSEVIE